jgi:hypothetical protein
MAKKLIILFKSGWPRLAEARLMRRSLFAMQHEDGPQHGHPPSNKAGKFSEDEFQIRHKLAVLRSHAAFVRAVKLSKNFSAQVPPVTSGRWAKLLARMRNIWTKA